MTDLDRFTEFLLREAAGYNEPPETPAGTMWPGIAVRLGSAGSRGRKSEKPRVVVGGGETFVDSVGYNEPPAAPRDEMWTRIESAWALRRAAGVSRLRPAWLGQRGAAGWVAALAAAASLVLGIGLGRGTRPSATDETVILPGTPAPAEMSRRVQTAPMTVAEPEPQEEDRPAEPVRTAALSGQVTVATDALSGGEGDSRVFFAVSEPAERSTRLSRTLEPDFDYATARHLGRAATLLTAFRTDRRTPASREDLAGWARELLVETRMFLGLSETASPVEEELLEDLELVLIQIAGLGPGAPDFEWDLARESMERQETLMRLRAVSAESET
ncbi:MAG: hypothetical protein F4139_09995 [Gemmatimonadetes bacterium]|nr:hypothetical protein [Gemmatimonadota bacterium]MYH53266.1 hypothetical protein [Gemmatimonadota bacterium]MYK65809.1 hypothetical protein [Gemmatimonadota bacterium]